MTHPAWSTEQALSRLQPWNVWKKTPRRAFEEREWPKRAQSIRNSIMLTPLGISKTDTPQIKFTRNWKTALLQNPPGNSCKKNLEFFRKSTFHVWKPIWDMHAPHTQMECASVHTDLLLRPLSAEREHIDALQCLRIHPCQINTLKKSDFCFCLDFSCWELQHKTF